MKDWLRQRNVTKVAGALRHVTCDVCSHKLVYNHHKFVSSICANSYWNMKTRPGQDWVFKSKQTFTCTCLAPAWSFYYTLSGVHETTQFWAPTFCGLGVLDAPFCDRHSFLQRNYNISSCCQFTNIKLLVFKTIHSKSTQNTAFQSQYLMVITMQTYTIIKEDT